MLNHPLVLFFQFSLRILNEDNCHLMLLFCMAFLQLLYLWFFLPTKKKELKKKKKHISATLKPVKFLFHVSYMPGPFSTPYLGDKLIQPLMTGILISWGPINRYGLGLMSLSPIIYIYMEMSWELIDPIAHIILWTERPLNNPSEP